MVHSHANLSSLANLPGGVDAVHTARAADVTLVGTSMLPSATGIDDETTAKPLSQVDLRVAKHWGRRLEAFAGINNLLNAGDRFTALLPFTVYGGLRGRY